MLTCLFFVNTSSTNDRLLQLQLQLHCPTRGIVFWDGMQPACSLDLTPERV
jgi:hypothetical protein